MNNYLTEIMEYAERAAPNEICGFLHPDGQGSMKFVHARNTQKLEEFLVDQRDVIAAYARGSVYAFAHSHCQHDHIFSDADLECINATRVPWFVYSLKSRQFNFRRPDGCIPPFVGREFILGMNDCVGLVTDYFSKTHGFTFPFFTRTPTNLHLGYSLDVNLMYNSGFSEVKDGSLRPSDVVFMKFKFDAPVTHCGVINGDGLLLHQVQGTVSSADKYEGAWKRMTKFVFRSPKFTSKLSAP